LFADFLFRIDKIRKQFLIFDFNYIKPNERVISESNSGRLFETLTRKGFDSWLGFAFERFCLKNASLLAQVMEFDQDMLLAAPYFGRKDKYFQIDLLFKRADHVITVCEVKHQNSKIGTKVIPEMERKCGLLKTPRGYAMEKALISLYSFLERRRMSMTNQQRLINLHLNQNFPRAVRGEGIYIFDSEGNRYLDACSGALVANLGHRAGAIAQAMTFRAETLPYVYRNHFSNPVAEELAVRYCDLTDDPMGGAYFTNSGSEASETAVKLARVRHLAAGENDRYKIITRWQSYHGITMAALSWSGLTAGYHCIRQGRRRRLLPPGRGFSQPGGARGHLLRPGEFCRQPIPLRPPGGYGRRGGCPGIYGQTRPA